MFIAILFAALLVLADSLLLLRSKDKDPGAFILSCALILPGPVLALILEYELLHLPSLAHILTKFLKQILPFYFQFMQP